MTKKRKFIKKEITWGGRTLSLETGKLAGQADAAILAQYGETVVLVTAVGAPAVEDLGYFPLSVDYEERMYASGKISGSRFVKREGRPSEEAVLTGRVIDRSIRPLFPKDYFNQVQIIVTVLSYDKENDPDIPTMLATSAALSISQIAWEGKIAFVRVGLKDGEFILNPTKEDYETSELDLAISFNRDKVVMIETGAKEVSEETIIKAIKFAKDNSKDAFKILDDLIKESDVEKEEYEVKEVDEEVKDKIISYIKDNYKDKIFNPEKSSRELGITEFKEELYSKFEGKLSKTEMNDFFENTVKKMVREAIVSDSKRPDGRALDEVREIEIETSLLPRTHGSAVFRRGDTQVITTTTLASTSLSQIIDSMEGESTKRFMHHYNFPPFSVGEVRRAGSTNRREIGHGALAEKAIFPIIPSDDKFPYTIRLVTEVLSSSGSTSMAATCGSTLALMDAGVPISSPVSGIAMGLVKEGDKYKVLTDIQALEDYYGDMDFKIAGTEKGVTAIQMDVKIDGLTEEMIEEIFSQSKAGRKLILDKMVKALPKYREELSKHAPRVTVIKIPPKKIGEVIGSGGKTINRIIDETGVAIDIEDDGKVMISGSDTEGVKKAIAQIESLTKEVEPGEIYDGTVKKVMDFGAFVEILPGKDGLVHISQLAEHRVEDINKEVSVGDKFKVKVMEVDNLGRINLTRKNIE